MDPCHRCWDIALYALYLPHDASSASCCTLQSPNFHPRPSVDRIPQKLPPPNNPIMAEAEIKEFFASGDKDIESDVLSELQSIMRLHEISAEDLFYKWESFCIKMDMDATNPEIAHIRNFKKDIQDALEKSNRQQTHIKTEKRGHATPRAGKGGDVFGMLDGLMPSTPGSGRLSKQGSLRKKTHVTPTMSRVKAEIPSSSPDYKGASKMEEQLNSMQP